MRRSGIMLCQLALFVAPGLGALGCSAPLGRAPVCQAGQDLTRSGACRASSSTTHRLPFRDGYTTKVMQGYHGYHSHKEDLAYSVDFLCEVGDPVVASRAGVVWDARGDSREGCGEAKCADMANYVVLDHGDGTFTEYYHLMHHGAMVRPGQQVCAGQLVGLCGNTGFSTGPHLHFAITDASRQTLPVRFEELRAFTPGGFAVPDARYRSRNTLTPQCATVDPSPLGPNAFAHQGIVLDAPTPMRVGRGKLTLRGRYLGEHPNVAVHRKAERGGKWTEQCFKVGADQRFTIELSWDDPAYPEGFAWFMLTGADERCKAPGWAWAYKVHVSGAPSRTSRDALRGPTP